MTTENPYAPPDSNVEALPPSVASGASLESGIRGEYEFEIGEVIRESWERLPGSKGVIWGAMILFGIISMALQVALRLLGLDGNAQIEAGNVMGAMAISSGTGILLAPVSAPLMAGFYMIALKHVAGRPVGIGELFKYFDRVVPLFIVSLLTAIATWLGLVLLILPGIFISVALMFSIPLVVAFDLGPVEAMRASIKAISHRWFSFFGLQIVFLLLIVLSMIPLLIGLIWSLPLFAVTMAVVFVRMFGTDWVEDI